MHLPDVRDARAHRIHPRQARLHDIDAIAAATADAGGTPSSALCVKTLLNTFDATGAATARIVVDPPRRKAEPERRPFAYWWWLVAVGVPV